jgi:uncharacterized phage protein (TIGR01671 family)
MREIKFRAWDKVSDCFVKYTLFLTIGGKEPISGMTLIDEDLFVLQEYIGLKDKNGKEIYEGDIVRSGSSTAIVEWDDYIDQDFYWGNACGFVFNFDPETMRNQASNSGVDYEVIGNTFEGVDK